MADRASILAMTIAVCERFAVEFNSPVRGVVDERTTLLDIISTEGESPDGLCVWDLINACEDKVDASLTETAQDAATTVGLLVDALHTAIMMPGEPPVPAETDATPTTDASLEDASTEGGIVIALFRTDHDEAKVGMGSTVDAAYAALCEKHPQLELTPGDEDVEFIHLAATADGWAGTLKF